MIVFHGSYIEVKKPRILESEKGKDFGFAFYVTTIQTQAEKMALRKCKRMAIVGEHAKAVVSVFEWDENLSNLKYIEYKKPDMEWLEMILKCRSNPTYKHGFDLVKGKIADDKVGETIGLVVDKIIKKEEAIEKLKYQKINDQIAFCTNKSIKGLKFIKSYEVELK